MTLLDRYLRGLNDVRKTGEATAETSYYGQVSRLLNDAGGKLRPAVICVLTTKNRGAGIPDGGLFVRSPAVQQAGEDALEVRAPERGVVEVKDPAARAAQVARTAQVRRYLKRYGRVLVCTYREFLVVTLGDDDEPALGEGFSLAKDEQAFWQLCAKPHTVGETVADDFEAYLERAMSHNAPLTSPADLASFLAAYARTARSRLEAAESLPALRDLRSALEDSLGLRFEGEDGERFFRSALVQTLWYGTFAAWTYWAEGNHENQFTWRQAQWTLQVPMVRVLFAQLANPAALPAGLDEVLDWTDEVLARVDRERFFQQFSTREAVTYFYEPFLAAYDPSLRRQLGVWYTPPEVVKYMVDRVDQALKDELGLSLGLADERVHVLDPCTGTGSFLVEVVERIARSLEEHHGDDLVGHEAKQSAMKRVHGFELLPAPFVIAHLQLGLLMQRLGVPLDPKSGERASIFLTNSLTGWTAGQKHPRLPFPEFAEERDAAEKVKRAEPILVILGNPPYNGFAGVSPAEEGGLVDPYKEGLVDEPWGITKNKLDDLYIRFWRVAERRIAERTKSGVICFITNMGWLGDPSTVIMRKRLLQEFDAIDIDCLNGDSRETGKKTPDGAPDPSIFSSPLNANGIQVGTAVSLLVRRQQHNNSKVHVRYRDWWGAGKRKALLDAVADPASAPVWDVLTPEESNWYRLRTWNPRPGYESWPAVDELAVSDPLLGMNENRAEGLMAHDKTELSDRIEGYLDSSVKFADLGPEFRDLTFPWADFDPEDTRKRLLDASPFARSRIKRLVTAPFDARWAYVDSTRRLWNRPRPELLLAAEVPDVEFLLVRKRAPRALDGAAFLWSKDLFDQHALHKDAYAIPTIIRDAELEADDDPQQGLDLGLDEIPEIHTRFNLSEATLDLLGAMGRPTSNDDLLLGQDDDAEDAEDVQDAVDDDHVGIGDEVFHHVLAMGWSPRYLDENADAIRNDWPRVPFPKSAEDLRRSSNLGWRIARLLDVSQKVPARDAPLDRHMRLVGNIRRADEGSTGGDLDLSVTAGWGVLQLRKTDKDPTYRIRIVMPGNGRLITRPRTHDERSGLTKAQIALLGEDVLDVPLNDHVFWSGVPQAVWDLKAGGFQILRKWLSYREERILGRPITADEARQFTTICRRLTELVLLGPDLDHNYLVCAGDPNPDQIMLLPEGGDGVSVPAASAETVTAGDHDAVAQRIAAKMAEASFAAATAATADDE